MLWWRKCLQYVGVVFLQDTRSGWRLDKSQWKSEDDPCRKGCQQKHLSLLPSAKYNMSPEFMGYCIGKSM
jgi:hypothetical protein